MVGVVVPVADVRVGRALRAHPRGRALEVRDGAVDPCRRSASGVTARVVELRRKRAAGRRRSPAGRPVAGARRRAAVAGGRPHPGRHLPRARRRRLRGAHRRAGRRSGARRPGPDPGERARARARCSTSASPGELFVALGQRIRAALGDDLTCVAALCDGTVGYIPTADAFADRRLRAECEPPRARRGGAAGRCRRRPRAAGRARLTARSHPPIARHTSGVAGDIRWPTPIHAPISSRRRALLARIARRGGRRDHARRRARSRTGSPRIG